jgi:hypothetical protein
MEESVAQFSLNENNDSLKKDQRILSMKLIFIYALLLLLFITLIIFL